VQKIEEAFNFIWHVDRSRGLGERFSRYLSALLVGPLLVFSAVGITAALANFSLVRDAMELEAIGWLAEQAGRVLPYLLVIGAFTFIYSFMPNTRVRFWPALGGGAAGGILWQSAGWAFALFAASSTKYAAIYSSFAILILFMLWLYLNWLILLFGASVSFYLQHPEYLVARGGEPRLSVRMRERLAFAITDCIARRHLQGGAPWTADALAQALRLPMPAVAVELSALQARGILAPTADEPAGWLPARDLGQVSAKDLLDAVHAAGEDRFLNPDALPVPAAVEQVLQRYETAAEGALRGISLRDLAARHDDKRT
jgi:membrane protein